MRANQRQLRKTNKNKYDMKEHIPVPPYHGVFKQGHIMGQSDRVVHNNITDDSFDELILASLATQEISNWGQL